MIIREKTRKINLVNTFFERWWGWLLLSLLIILLAFLFLGLWKLAVLREAKEPVVVHTRGESLPVDKKDSANVANAIQAVQTEEVLKEKRFVASKNGNRYYLPTCSGVSRIKEDNKIWFSTEEEAEYNGYSPAAHCDGI